ncbi:MAG: SDR family NAD(P)-dependent oxidoreductase, partial [Myxococcota bacterium]
RQTVAVREEAAAPAVPPSGAGDVVVASGGARGVTASSLIALAATTQCRLVLLGRTPLEAEDPAFAAAADDASLKRLLLEQARSRGEAVKPAEVGRRARRIQAGREIRAALEAVSAAGGEARYEAVDVSDAAALSATLDAVRSSWGPIAAIVHGAGVLADKFLADKSDDDFAHVFDTKVLGLDALLRAEASDPLKVLCCFSSVAGRAGNAGQSDYAMANEVLNKVCAAERARRGPNFVAKSIGWGPWEGGMVTPALKAHFESMGVPLIPIEGGAKAFVQELMTPARGFDGIETVAGASPDAWRGGALAADEATFTAFVDAERFAFLDGHRVQGKVVVPVVLVLEWFAQAAQAFASHFLTPPMRFVRCEDVKVLKGLVLENFESSTHRFVITAKKVSNGDGATLGLELRNADGHPCYRASAFLAEESPTAFEAPVLELPTLDLPSFEGRIYGDVLFHGDQFQVIRGGARVGNEGAEAQMIGARTMGWSGSGWQSDPALLDGGLQLALLWSAKRLGGHALPTSVDAFTLHRRGLPQGGARVQLVAREADGDRGVCDVTFSDESGPIAELRGVTTHVLPGSRS